MFIKAVLLSPMKPAKKATSLKPDPHCRYKKPKNVDQNTTIPSGADSHVTQIFLIPGQVFQILTN